MVNDGFDLEDIYERYASIPKHKISHWIRQNGDKNFYKPWTRDEDKALQSLMDGGADRETIGKVMGRSVKSVYNRVNKLSRGV